MIAASKMNVLYSGIKNPLDVVVEGYKCNDYVLSTDNGVIEGDSCNYEINPLKPGSARIYLHTKNSKHKLIYSAFFRVKSIPEPEAQVSWKHGGDIKRSVLKAQIGIGAVALDVCARYEVEEYTVIIISKGKISFVQQCKSARFPLEVREAFDKLETADVVVFSGMLCKSPTGTHDHIQPIEFRIIQ